MSENFKCRPTDVMIKLDERNPAQDMFSVPFHCEKSLVLQLQQMRCFECRQLDYVSANLCSCPSFVPSYLSRILGTKLLRLQSFRYICMCIYVEHICFWK